MNDCREIHYSGRVQGVGFRYATHRLAADFRVSGTVQNLPDGRVKLVVQGEQEEVDRFVDALGELMARNIEDSSCRMVAPRSDLSDFRVVY